MLPLKRTPGPSTWCNHILYNYKASVKRRIDSIDESDRICVYRFDESIETATLTTDKVEGMSMLLYMLWMDRGEITRIYYGWEWIANEQLYSLCWEWYRKSDIVDGLEFASFVDTEKIEYNTQAEYRVL